MTTKLMLAHNFTNQNVVGWHMSEKLDGIRAYWDGYKFYSRSGKENLYFVVFFSLLFI